MQKINSVWIFQDLVIHTKNLSDASCDKSCLLDIHTNPERAAGPQWSIGFHSPAKDQGWLLVEVSNPDRLHYVGEGGYLMRGFK